jgi:hypothetical protein
MILTRCLTTFAFFVALMMAREHSKAEDLNFLGIDIFAEKGNFLVTKSAYVRVGPMTESKKLGELKVGEEVRVVGRAKKGAGWMAIQKNGTDYGFVYEPILLPKIDGTLKESISGSVVIEEHSQCGYTFNFHDKNIVEGENYVFSDYEITYQCNGKEKPFRLLAAMFMSEVPFRLTREPVFQISIDLMEVENGYDEIFSTIFEYRLKEKKVVFVGISLKGLAKIPKEKERPANSVAEALKAAVEIAPGAWGAEAWKQIHKAQFESDQ